MWAVVSAGSMISATVAGRCGPGELGRDASAMIPPSPDFDGAADRKHGRDIGSASYAIVPDLRCTRERRRGGRGGLTNLNSQRPAIGGGDAGGAGRGNIGAKSRAGVAG